MKTGMMMAALTACLALAGCGQSAHKVDWYKQHRDAMAKKIAWCKQDAPRLASADCQNAMEARAELWRAAPLRNSKTKSY